MPSVDPATLLDQVLNGDWSFSFSGYDADVVASTLRRMVDTMKRMYPADDGEPGEDTPRLNRMLVMGAFLQQAQVSIDFPEADARQGQFAELAYDYYSDEDEQCQSIRRMASTVAYVVRLRRTIASDICRLNTTLRFGNAGLAEAPKKKDAVVYLTQDIVKLLSQWRWRRRGAVLYREILTDARQRTRTWKPVVHPEDARREYTIDDMVVRETSRMRNVDFNDLLKGHVINGDVNQVAEALKRSQFPNFTDIYPYPHAWATSDGVYISFLPQHGAFPPRFFDKLWGAVAAGDVRCRTNFGEGAHYDGALAASRRNGRFLADVFLTRAQADTYLPATFTCSRYIPFVMADKMGADHTALHTPIVDYILDCQFGDPGTSPLDRTHRQARYVRRDGCADFAKYSADVRRIVMCITGRMFFPNDRYSVSESNLHELNSTLDSWEFAPVMIGKGLTGKSTLGMVVQQFMAPEDVGVLPNKSEEVFGLQSLGDKRALFALEVKKDFNFDVAQLQQMISGEKVSYAMKNRDPTRIHWRAPIMIACNETPDIWDDAQNALSRRFVHVNFAFRVPLEPPPHIRHLGDLQVAIHKSDESLSLLRKMILSYFAMADRHGGNPNIFAGPVGCQSNPFDIPQEDFDPYPLPKPFHVWSHNRRGDMNILRQFITSPKAFVQVPSLQSTMDALHDIPSEELAECYTTITTTPISAAVAAAKAFCKDNARTSYRAGATINVRTIEETVEDATNGMVLQEEEDSDATRVLQWDAAVFEESPSLTVPLPSGATIIGPFVLRRTADRALRQCKATSDDAFERTVRFVCGEGLSGARRKRAHPDDPANTRAGSGPGQ